LTESFRKYLTTSPRSNEKLKIVHGAIASHLKLYLNGGEEKFTIYSLGFERWEKRNISGRYIDKVVDIVVLNELGQTISGIAFKFVMSE